MLPCLEYRYNKSFCEEVSMKKCFVLTFALLGCLNNVFCAYPEKDKECAKNILNAYRQASNSPECQLAYVRVNEEFIRALGVLFDQMKSKLNAEEQLYVRDIMVAIQEVQLELNKFKEAYQNLSASPEEQLHKLANNFSLLQSKVVSLLTLLEPFFQQLNYPFTAEESVNSRALILEMYTKLTDTLKQFSEIGLLKFSGK
jgi:hypothetical protein